VAFPGRVDEGSPVESVEGIRDATRSSSSLVGKCVYVVDDEIDIRKSMCALLEMWEMTARTAASPADANALFADWGPPDVLIADLRLGSGEHGAAMAERLRRKFGSFAVLIITGETVSDALRQANEDGYVVLQKPIAPEALHEAIYAAVRGAPTRDAAQ
jgi:two-component system, sensor histidine kinase